MVRRSGMRAGRPSGTRSPRSGRRVGAARASDRDDFWPLLVEFTLSQRAWWIGICDEFGLTAMQGHSLRMLDPERPVPMSILADTLVCDASNVTGIVDKLEA